MNEILRAIEERRSIRAYTSDMPERKKIDAVMNAGICGATGRNSQSVIIIAITDKETRDKYARANAAVMGAQTDPFYNAPVIFTVLARRDAPTYSYDGSIALANMMLAAHSLDMGACWIHRAKEVFATDEWREWLRSLGVEGDYEGIGNLAFGYRAGDYPPKKEKAENRKFYV